MKKGLLLLIALVLVAGCGKQQKVQLEKGTPAYELAVSLSEAAPFVDPEKNDILIKSDDWEISSGEVMQHIYLTSGSHSSQLKRMGSAQVTQIIENAAVGLAERKLILKAAEKQGITVTAQELDSILAINYQHFGGEEEFNNLVTKNGQSLDFVRSDIQERLVIEKYVNSLFKDAVTITDEELQEEYAAPLTATVRHILFTTRDKSDSEIVEIKKKAEEVLQKAKSGEDFVKLVEIYSEDPGSKTKGGLYADFPRGRMVKPFEDAAFTLPVGSISDLVETQFGYHIIKVENRKTESKPFDEVKEKLRSDLQQEKEKELYEQNLLMLKTAVNYDIVGF